VDKALLVKIAGFPATLIQGDPLVLDRWIWLRKRLPNPRGRQNLLDVGCGSGAFTIGAALLGYQALGLSWDERNQRVAEERAALCGASRAKFEVWDVRKLGKRADLKSSFDVVVCFENIEHIMDDRKLVKDMAAMLRPGGRLLLTTPHLHYRAISASDNGPFSRVEDGGHVRRGYSQAMLEALCAHAKLRPKAFSSCGGFLSQKITFFLRTFSKIRPLFGWACVLPLRILPPIVDGIISSLSGWPDYSICMEAYKPMRHENQG